ncbi:MAG: PKD domain-containing protein [Puia sp.]|nr:PKD domain-containing protein [Puia sp.]
MRPYPAKDYLTYGFIFLALLIGNAVSAQLNAGFSMDRSGGCSPLVVNFTNTTTGASSNAVYKWDFGNGNSSALVNGAAVYTAEQTYTVTLTVQDGGNQSVSTQQVTVYTPPTVNFSVAPAKLCLGTPAVFTSSSTPGSGSIASYTWDFGDGSTLQGTSNVQSYTYSVEQTASVSLTVTNIYGCHTLLRKANIVTVIPALTAAFTADKRVLCLTSDPVQFTNSSTGPGTLDYLWSFGDGNTSTQQSPTYVFNKKGNYTVSLQVHSSEGCTAVSTQTNPINVANYSTSFSVPSPICQGSTVAFSSQSSPAPDNSVWSVDGVTQYNYGTLYYAFNTVGAHTITLNNTFGTCPQSVSKQISVKGLPAPNGFNVDIAGKCGSPVAVNFKDVTPGAVAWSWNFNYYNGSVGSTVQAPTYTYTYDGSFLVWLQVTNADGCSATTSQYVTITRPTVSISPTGPGTLSSCTTLLTNTFTSTSSEPLTITKWDFGDGTTSTAASPTHTFKNTGSYTVTLSYTTVNGCTGTATTTQFSIYPPPPVSVSLNTSTPATCTTPITATFTANSQLPIATWNWTFGDGSQSTDPSPTHTYSNIGSYVAVLNYTTQSGCKGTAYSNALIIDPKIKLDFSFKPNPVCGNNTVYFSTTANTYDINTYNWSYGDGGGNYSANPSPTYTYNAAGSYTITLYAKNLGGCDTTITKTITVKPPFPQITGHSNTCDGTRGAVTFTQASVGATTIVWNFGDGSTTTTPGDQATATHTYTKSGTYSVYLTATNGQCTLVANDPSLVYVLLKQSPNLTGSASSACSGTPVAIQISQLDANPYQNTNIYSSYYYAGYYFQAAQYRDGTPFNGSRTDNLNNNRWTTTYNGTLTNFQTGEKDIRFILTSYVFGCQDTTNYMPLAIKGATGGFEVVADKLCYQSPVLLQDTSHSTPDNPILSWQWNFGDGQTLTSSKGGAISHNYASPGGYTVSLKITDGAGCSTNIPYTQYVNVNGPLASFYPSGTDVHLNTTVYFYNTTNDYGNSNTVYTWNFGDGSTSTDLNPSHTYATPGTYIVTMTASNPSLPCQSTATPVTIIVRNFNSAFSFSSSYVAGSCPPLLVSFVNTSYNYISVSWDFGDGNTAGNVNYPSHVYAKPGKYIVTLNVNAYNGLVGKYIDSVIITDPVITLPPPPPETCIDDTVTLSATATQASSYSWDFGDGSIVPADTGTARHQYLTAGTYKATLLVQNNAGCVKDTTLQQPVTIRPDPVVTITPLNPVLCLSTSVSLQASGGSVYQWSPAVGLSNPAIANPVASPRTTTAYTLTVKDDIGCTSKAPLMIKVVPPGNLQVSPDTAVCDGASAQLVATGETLYQWINDTNGLSNTEIPNPVALAPVTTTYTVKGSDAYSCFVSQATVTVTVHPLPTVNAGPDVVVQAGYDAVLNATGSSDVTSWNWVPEKYLSCYDCPSPDCTPLATTPYFVTVKNQYGCKASDTVVVAVDCEESHVRIPNAFTPNGDGKNDVFIVKGISIIKHMAIYDRFGEQVYERNNFIAGDRSACWDGTFRGQACPSGAYVYFVEMECPTGGVFSRKGSFVLIR